FVLVSILPVGIVRAAPVPVDEPGASRVDPLPPCALARLGSDRLRNGGQVLGLAFAPDGKTLLGPGADGTLRVWRRTTGKEIRLLPAFPWSATKIAFAPDGKTMAVGSMTLGIALFDPATGKELRRLKHTGHVEALAFAPDGKLLAAGDMAGDIILYDPT